MATNRSEVGTLDEEYHVASRNALSLKCSKISHQIHYSPEMQVLTASAPLRFTNCERSTLPRPELKSFPSLYDVILSRKSSRSFPEAPLGIDRLSTLLFLGNAVREVTPVGNQHTYFQRNVPNSGNLGSVEIFPIVLNVAAIKPGIYHYDSVSHDLAHLRMGHYGKWLKEQVFYQGEFSSAGVALVLVASVGRLKKKYGLRGYRLALLDTGHVAQNLQLAAAAMELTACPTAGFIDDELDAGVGADGLDCASMLVVLVGSNANAEMASK